MNITPWLTKQSSPIVTSSQTKAWDCTRVCAPITTSFCTLGKWADETIITDLAAIKVAGLDDPDPRAEFNVSYTGLMKFPAGSRHGTEPAQSRHETQMPHPGGSRSIYKGQRSIQTISRPSSPSTNAARWFTRQSTTCL